MRKLLTSMLLGLMAVTAANAYDISSLETFNAPFTNYPAGPVNWQGSVSSPTTCAGCTWIYTKDYENPAQYPYHPEWVGKQIVGVKVTNLLTENVDNFKLFVLGVAEENGDPNTDWQTNKLAVADATNNNGTIEAFFDTPVTIETGHTYYPGYQFDVTSITSATQHPYPTFLGEGKYRFGWIWQPGSSSWENIGWINQNSWRSQPIFVYLYDPSTGDVEEVPMATPQQPESTSFKVNQPVNLTIPVTYTGNLKMANIEYSYTFNNSTVTGQNTFLPAVQPNQTGNITLALGSIAEAGTYPFSLTVTKVNNKDNTATDKTVSCNLTIREAIIPTYDPADLTEVVIDYKDFAAGPSSWYNPKSGVGSYAGCRVLWTKNIANNPSYPYHPEWIGKQVVGVKVTNQPASGIDNLKVILLPSDTRFTSSPIDNWQTGALAVSPATLDGNALIGWFEEPVTLEAEKNYFPGYSFDVTEVNSETRNPFPLYKAEKIGSMAQVWGPGSTSWNSQAWVSSSADYYYALPITVYLYAPSSTGIENVSDNESVLSTTYYDLSGREVKDAKGLVIKVEALAGGNLRTSKVIVK